MMASRRLLSGLVLLVSLANTFCLYASRLDNRLETSNQVYQDRDWHKMVQDLNQISRRYSQAVDHVMDPLSAPGVESDKLHPGLGAASSLLSLLDQPMVAVAMRQLRNEDCGPDQGSDQMDVALAKASSCLSSLDPRPYLARWEGAGQAHPHRAVAAISCRVFPAVLQCLRGPISVLGSCSNNVQAVWELLYGVDALTLEYCRGTEPLIVDSLETSDAACVSQGLRRMLKYVSPSYLSYVYPRSGELLQCQYIRYARSMLNSVLLNYCGSTEFRSKVQDVLGNYLNLSDCSNY